MVRHLPSSPRTIFNKFVNHAAVVAFFFVASSVDANAEPVQYSVRGASGEAFGISYDACSYSQVFITVAEHGTNLNIDANNFAYAFIYRADWCQHLSTAAYGFAQNVTFSAASSANGHVPQSVSASGQISLHVYSTANGNSVDTLTFQLILTLVRPVTEYGDDSRPVYQVGGSASRSDRIYGVATVSSSLSANTLGPLPRMSHAQICNTKSPAGR
jgi:hypothetical protein